MTPDALFRDAELTPAFTITLIADANRTAVRCLHPLDEDIDEASVPAVSADVQLHIDAVMTGSGIAWLQEIHA